MAHEISRREAIVGLVALVAGTALLGTAGFHFKEHKKIEKQIPIQIFDKFGKERNIIVPDYSAESVPENHCSRYVRFSAEDLFNKNYSRNDSWNLRYNEEIIYRLSEKNWQEEVQQIAKEGILEPGMVVGIYNSRSNYRDRLDKQGNPVRYTHVAIFIGADKNGNPLFAEKLGKKTQVVSPNEISEAGCRIVEVLDVKKK